MIMIDDPLRHVLREARRDFPKAKETSLYTSPRSGRTRERAQWELKGDIICDDEEKKDLKETVFPRLLYVH